MVSANKKNLNCFNSGVYLFYLASYGAAPIGAMWLHDIMRTTFGTPRAGWVGTYVLPEHRGLCTTMAMWEVFYETLTAIGVQHMYIASHCQNTRAHTVAECHLGFHRVGVYPAFAICQGQPADFLILSMNEAEREEAWALAQARARPPAAPGTDAGCRRYDSSLLSYRQVHPENSEGTGRC